MIVTTLCTSPDTLILRLLLERPHATAAAIGTACRMKPGEVRSRLAGLESQRLIAGRQDDRVVAPARVFVITSEGQRKVGRT